MTSYGNFDPMQRRHGLLLLPEAQIMLLEGRAAVQLKYRDLQTKYISRNYKTDRGREYADHGFCRRLDELARAIDFVFSLLPPELDEIPEYRRCRSRDNVDPIILSECFRMPR